jgi:hypothetical protein
MSGLSVMIQMGLIVIRNIVYLIYTVQKSLVIMQATFWSEYYS